MQTACEPKTENNERELNRRKKIIFAGVAFLLLIILAVGGWLYVDSLAYKLCRVEAGVLVTPSDFLKNQDEAAFFTEDSQPFSITEPGRYQVKVKSGWFTHSCILVIQDTIAPAGQAVPIIYLELGERCVPEDFVENISDATAVDIAYENAALNGVGRDRYRVLSGDVLDRGGFLESLGGGYDIVVANIVADVIIALAPLAAGLLGRGGVFLCSGIIEGRADEAAAALNAAGLEIRERREDNGWYAFTCQ